MALFKILKGQSQNLPSELHEGYAYFLTDTGEFYVDISDSERKQLSAEKLSRTRSGETEVIEIDDLLLTLDHIDDKENPHNVTAEQAGADPAGSANQALTNAKAYTDERIQSIPTPDVSGQINEHNLNGNAHPDIRAELAGKEQAGAANQALEDAKAYTDEKFSDIPGGTVYVNITGNDPYTADKTFEELQDAYNSGSFIVAILDGSIFHLDLFIPNRLIRFTQFKIPPGDDNNYKIIDGMITIRSNNMLMVSTTVIDGNSLYFSPESSGLESKTVGDAIEEVYNKSKQYVDAAIGAALEASY